MARRRAEPRLPRRPCRHGRAVPPCHRRAGPPRPPAPAQGAAARTVAPGRVRRM